VENINLAWRLGNGVCFVADQLLVHEWLWYMVMVMKKVTLQYTLLLAHHAISVM